MSDIFKNNLKKFLADRISMSELEIITAQEANANDAQKHDLQHIILELFNRKIITKSVFDKLYLAVSAPHPSQGTADNETGRQLYQETNEGTSSTQTKGAASKATSPATPPEPKIPFQESLKRFQQRKNTLRDLEKSLSDEIADNLDIIPKYRMIIQKLEQQQLLHHSVCDQLNDCLNTLENQSKENTQSPQVISQIPSQDSATDTKDQIPNVSDEQAPVDSRQNTSTLSAIIDNFATRRLSYEAFEGQILQATVRLDDKHVVISMLDQGLADNKFPDVVYQSIVQTLREQFSELNDLRSTTDIDVDQAGDNVPTDNLPADNVPTDNVPTDTAVTDAVSTDIAADSLSDVPTNTDESESQSTAVLEATNTVDDIPPFDELGDFDIEDFDIDDIIGQPEDAPQQDSTSQDPLRPPAVPPFDEPSGDAPPSLDDNVNKEPAAQAPETPEVSEEKNIEASSTGEIENSPLRMPDTTEPALSPDEPDILDDKDSSSAQGEQLPDGQLQDEQIDNDKTQIRFSPSAASQARAKSGTSESSRESAHESSQEPADDDKTVIQPRRPAAPIDDDDKTRIQMGDKTDRTSNTQDFTSRTSQTSATSSTGTSSTWSKPFEAPQEVVEIRIGAVIKDRFRLTGFIGQGGMGDVYKAEDLRRVDAGDVETEVAIKLLNNEFKDHPDSLKSLQREARKTQNLAHPHIVNVFDFDRDQYHVFMTMELMRGDPLDKAIKKNKKGFGLSLATKYISELSSALDYAHRRGIVHSDLKPGNVFLSNGEIKVFDFGIARAASGSTDKDAEQDTFDAGSIGALTPSYASPEMLDGVEDADPRDDIYALGCIAYELLTGKHPFLKDGRKVPSNVARDENLKPPKIPGLKKWQAEALQSCLSFDLARRPANVAKFLDVFLLDSIQVTTKQKIIRALGATCILGLSAGSYFYYQSYKISSFAALVDNNAHEQLLEESEELLLKDRASQLEIFDNPNIRDKFREYLSNRAKQLAQQNQFLESDKMIALARKVYPDSAAINRIANEIVDIQNNRKIELYDQLDKLLSEKDYFATDYQKLRDVWQSIAVIAPNDERLQNTQPVFAFEELINELIEQDKYIDAKDVSDYAIDFLSQYAVFEGYLSTINRLGNDIQRLQERSLNDERILNLVASLSALKADTSLVAIEPFLDNIERLSNLDPNNTRLLELQVITKPLLNQALEELFDTYGWQQATELVQQYASAVSKNDLINSQDRIAQAELAWTDTVNKLKQDIRVRARQASPKSAEQLLPELESIGASDVELAEMSDAIAQSWILQSRRLQESGNWDGAKTALESAQNLSVSIQMVESIQSEFDSLSLAQTQIVSQLDREQQEALQAQKIRRIRGFESTITDIASNQDITQNNLSQFTAAIDSLRIEEPNNNLIASSEVELITRITQTANQLSAESVDEAIALLNLGAQFFPTNNDISSLNSQLNTLKQTKSQQENATRFTELSEKLDQVVQGELNADSFDEISTILAQISRLRSFDAQANQLAVKAASAFVEKSKTQLSELRFDEARDTLRYASTIDPSGTNSVDLVAQIDQAEQQFEQGQSELREQSRLESLRTNLLSRILTMDFDRAKEVRTELEQAGGLDREFSNQVRETFVEKYSERAERSANEQKFGEAKSWINEAIQEDSNNNALSRLYDLYNTAENIVDTALVNPGVAEQLKQAALGKFPNSDVIAAIDLAVSSPEPVSEKPQTAPVEPISQVVEPTSQVVEPTSQVVGSDTQPDLVISEPLSVKLAPVNTPAKRPSDCLATMAGTGDRTSCRDDLEGKDKGPYLVVLPPYNGQSFAISKYEVRVGEYNMYCGTTGDCQEIGGNQLLPVTNLSITDVNKFVDWLSVTTGYTYRVPTQSEWQFAATADNTKTPTIKNCKVFSGSVLQYGIKLENINFQRRQTSNSWGVSNYLGNAQELITVSGGYRAIGGHFEDSFSDCEVSQTRSVQNNLDDKTGLRLIREL